MTSQIFKDFIDQHQHFIIIQAENPDGDSLGTALALEGLLTKLNKKVSLYCPVNIPSYMRYFKGWDRVTDQFDYQAEAAIVIDTTSQILLSKVLEDPINNNFLATKPVLVIDHHADVEPDLNFDYQLILEPAVATAEIIYKIAQELDYEIDAETAENMLAAIASDTLGLTTENVDYTTYAIASELLKSGANITDLENRRRELAKKEPEILKFKGELIERISYELDGQLALVEITFDDIKQYSDKYNPSMLVLDEMRQVKGVEVALAIKTYPDGKLTGKIRSNQPVANIIAGYFGGGGHAYAAGFRIYDETYESILPEVLKAVESALEQ